MKARSGEARLLHPGWAGAVKIGSSGHPEGRLCSLQVAHASPLLLLAKVSGGVEAERKLHKILGESRLLGEWFKPSRELTEIVEAAKAGDISKWVGHHEPAVELALPYAEQPSRYGGCRADADVITALGVERVAEAVQEDVETVEEWKMSLIPNFARIEVARLCKLEGLDIAPDFLVPLE